MADSTIAITAGTGTAVDTRTESTNGHHRQVIVIGDPAENNSVLGVNASQGIKTYSETPQPVTNSGLSNLDTLLSTRLASGSTLPITNRFLENLDVLLSTRLASGSTLPITNTYLDIPLSTRLASGSTLPITNGYLANIDTLLSTRLASGTTVPIMGTVSVTGVATSAKQDTIIGHVDGIEALLGTIDGDTSTLAGAVTANKVQVDVVSMPAGGSGLTDAELRATPVPVSGTVAVTNAGLSNIDVGLSTRLASGSTLPITNTYLQNLDVLLSTRLASGSTLPMTNAFLDVPLSTRLASGSTLPVVDATNNVLRSTRLASGSTLPVTNQFLDIALSTRLASGSTLPITNAFLPNLDVTLGSRLASGSTLPITGAVSILGHYGPSLVSLASGTNNKLLTDVNGNLNVNLNTKWTNSWLSASGTYTIMKSTGGMLHLVTIEMLSSPTLSIYDNASGISGTLIANLNAGAPMGNYLQDIYVTGGISVKAHIGVAPSIKISYR